MNLLDVYNLYDKNEITQEEAAQALERRIWNLSGSKH